MAADRHRADAVRARGLGLKKSPGDAGDFFNQALIIQLFLLQVSLLLAFLLQ